MLQEVVGFIYGAQPSAGMGHDTHSAGCRAISGGRRGSDTYAVVRRYVVRSLWVQRIYYCYQHQQWHGSSSLVIIISRMVGWLASAVCVLWGQQFRIIYFAE